ncbi:MAG: carboxypeptidase-like regulatory domain-containing protein [Chlorobi bacterium]|nr:carboxypeptidase-like regulatory domain-containing protein [Chlorobiota bacterium]
MKTVNIILLALIIPINIVLAGNENIVKKGEKMKTTVNVTGKVIDRMTGEALTGVKIEVPGTSSIIYTDFDGNFIIKDLKPGVYEVESSLISYYSKKVKVNLDSQENIKIELVTVN